MALSELTKSERTQERILAAATEEFAAFGIAGSRVDRIAKAARANKSLIYEYFGNKEQLFQAVLKKQLRSVYSAVHFDPSNLPGYAIGLFDFAMDHPSLMRLVMWNGLDQNQEWPLDDALTLSVQVEEIRRAQSDGRVTDSFPAEFILTLIISLASAWTAANPFGRSITPEAVAQRDLLKNSIEHAIRLQCDP